MSSSQPAQSASPTQPADDEPVAPLRPGTLAKGQLEAVRRPNTFLTATASVVLVLVTAAVVSSIIGDQTSAAPGLRKPTARPSILKDAGYVVQRTTGPGIERY